MGIPAYFSSIIKNYPEVIKKKKDNLIIKRFFLDCNSIIYDCFHNLLKEESQLTKNIDNLLIKKVILSLDYYYKNVGNNCELLFLAFDGIAPLAKLEQQKTRRYRGEYENKLLKKNVIWNTCSISPGTLFMIKLEREIKNHYNKDKKVIVSFSDEGEGEHKIFDYIRKQKYLDGNNVIYGLDSDLIMLSLENNIYCENIYLYREMPDFIKSIDSNLNPNEMYMIDINIFKESIELYMSNFISNKKIRVSDYIFICFLLGNDFLPHFPSINLRRNGMDFILDSYIKILGKGNNVIIEDGNIKWKNFRNLVIELGNNEEDFLKEEYVYRNKMSKRHYTKNNEEEEKEYLNNLPIIEREKEIYINPYEEGWESRYYYILFDIDKNDLSVENYNNKIQEICINYLQGLEWTYKYYSKGCVDWKWKYNYHYPPLLIDLKKYIPFFEGDLLETKFKNNVNNLVQLYYILPKDEKLYNSILHNSIVNKFLKLNKNYNSEKLSFETSFCRYFWESHLINNNEIPIYILENNLKN